jgi:ssDNA-binding Zn-finger/Zn-ribbon topoisomerase 1
VICFSFIVLVEICASGCHHIDVRQKLKTPVNKSEFITDHECHIRDSRSHALRLFIILVGGLFAIAGFGFWLDPRYPEFTPFVILALIVTLVLVCCSVANAAIRNSASTHGLRCPQCGKTLGQARVAAVAIATGKCGFCGYTLFQETQEAEQGVTPQSATRCESNFSA